MATAAAAVDFGPQHSEGTVLGLANRVFKRLIETRPASAALELGLRGEQRQVATGAGEDALAMCRHGATRPSRRGTRRRRTGSGLAIGLGQPGIADSLLDVRPLAVTSQPAGSRRACPAPHADAVSGDPADRATRPYELEWRK